MLSATRFLAKSNPDSDQINVSKKIAMNKSAPPSPAQGGSCSPILGTSPQNFVPSVVKCDSVPRDSSSPQIGGRRRLPAQREATWRLAVRESTDYMNTF